MKVAYLLPGFVRDTKYFEEILKFKKLNLKHRIDIYSNTYDVIGSPHKEPADKKGYINSPKIDLTFFERYLDYKGINIENYEMVDEEISNFSSKYYNFIKSSPGFVNSKSSKMGCIENEQSTLRSYYGQVRNIYKSYKLIENPETYDLIIKSRYDAWVSQLDLNYYEKYIDHNTLFGMDYDFSVTLDNGVLNNTLSDIVVFGDPVAMKTWCEIGKEDVFSKVYQDKNLSSKEYENRCKGADIKTQLESVLCYNYFVLNGNKKHIKIDPKHLPNGAYLPRVKYPTLR